MGVRGLIFFALRVASRQNKFDSNIAMPVLYHKQDWYFPLPLHAQNPAGLLAKANLVFQLTSPPGNKCVS